MVPQSCKRLVQSDFPIAAMSKRSEREKCIRYGRPSTLLKPLRTLKEAPRLARKINAYRVL